MYIAHLISRRIEVEFSFENKALNDYFVATILNQRFKPKIYNQRFRPKFIFAPIRLPVLFNYSARNICYTYRRMCQMMRCILTYFHKYT